MPYQAKLFDEFLPEEELLPMAQAIAPCFARLGEKKNRNPARLKFLVTKLGIDEFKRLVLEERAKLRTDPRWTEYLADIDRDIDEQPLKPPSLSADLDERRSPRASPSGHASNVYQQRQQGYATATVALPLGDITADQTARWSRTSPATTWAKRCARRSSRTSCCAGSARPTCPRSTPT